MHLLKNQSMRFYLGLVLILALAIGGSAVASFADSGTGATVAVNHGNLSESAPTAVAAAPVTLTGDDQTTTYSLGLTVTDARGIAAGWNLTIAATQFTGSSSDTLPSGASTINGAPTVVCSGVGGHCTPPTNSVSYPLTVLTSAARFFNAAANSGLGKFTITPTVTVAIPGNTIADTYTSTVSVAVVSGP